VSNLHRRLGRLEQSRPEPSPWDATDAIFAALDTSELIALIECVNAREHGRVTSAEQEAVYGRVRDRLVAFGIAPP
jgi:hypothetical protein